MHIQVETTKNNEVIDITDTVSEHVDIENGVVHVFIAHTTAALTTADLDPGTDQDMLGAFSAMIPDLEYRHPHDPSHVGDHIISSIIGPSVNVPVSDGELVLGTWQRIVLVEMDGPRARDIYINNIASSE